MKPSDELTEFVSDLQKEAQEVRATAWTANYYDWVDAGKLHRFVAGLRLLLAKLGPYGQVWDKMITEPEYQQKDEFEKLSGVLDAIANALKKGRLSTIEELVSADVLGDLLEHAEELLRSKFYLAAAIVMRAILEERLRKLCGSNACQPTVNRPTIEHFKQSLYAANVIDKIVVKDIDWMASVGNAAAHQLPEYNDADVPQLHTRLTALLTRFSG